jgi:hypothetical protein
MRGLQPHAQLGSLFNVLHLSFIFKNGNANMFPPRLDVVVRDEVYTATSIPYIVEKQLLS